MAKVTKSNKETEANKEMVNYIPWHSYVFLAITYLLTGICIGKWIGSCIDPLILIVGIWGAIQMSVLIYLSLKDLNKTYNRLFNSKEEDI